MIRSIIKKHLVPSDDYIFGFADLHGLIGDLYDGFHYGISIGKRLNPDIVDRLDNGPTIEYFNHYTQINRELADLTQRIHDDLSRIGIDSIRIEPTISTESKDYAVYLETLSYDISHKMVATRAGLGWIGKTDLFISTAFGPRLRLVSLLLRQNPGLDSKPIEKSQCGLCRICVDHCPAHAANGKSWNINVHRDEFFNARQCREKCGELTRQKLNVDERICGMCVSVCPKGKRKKA
ncbi:MAG: hypothetical protein KBA26_05820 [Candidatus Delongbacteria bacterium]|nr:hypothetical protein [Candidatus Delongbacteria bacterium]